MHQELVLILFLFVMVMDRLIDKFRSTLWTSREEVEESLEKYAQERGMNVSRN